MRRLILLIMFFSIFTTPSFATDTTKVEVRASTDDGTSVVIDSGIVRKVFTTGVRQQQTIALANGANTITVPNNTKGVMFAIGSVRSLHLKGVTGDRGISLDSAVPVLLPLSYDSAGVSTNTIVISSDNASSVNINAIWL